MRKLKLNAFGSASALGIFNKTCLSALSLMACLQVAEGQTFELSDNLAADGSGGAGSGANVETAGLYRQSDGATGNPSGYNALMVGSAYGGSDIYRAVTTFDLSGLPAAPAGFEYEVTDVSLVLEVSGGSGARPATLIDFYEGSFQTGTLPSSADASFLFDVGDSTFVTTSLGATTLDLATDTSISFTLDAPLAAGDPGGNYYTFGSGSGPNIGFGGTGALIKSPELEISYNLVAAVPEPSSALLLLSGMAFACFGRRRQA